MDMIVNMIGAEAVIPGAARAVAKLKTRVFRVSTSANCALMVIKAVALFLFDSSGFLPEIDCGTALLFGY